MLLGRVQYVFKTKISVTMLLSTGLPGEYSRLYFALQRSSERNHLSSVAASLLTVQHSPNMWPIKWDYKGRHSSKQKFPQDKICFSHVELLHAAAWLLLAPSLARAWHCSSK